jgi:hypothetical protein
MIGRCPSSFKRRKVQKAPVAVFSRLNKTIPTEYVVRHSRHSPASMQVRHIGTALSGQSILKKVIDQPIEPSGRSQHRLTTSRGEESPERSPKTARSGRPLSGSPWDLGP